MYTYKIWCRGDGKSKKRDIASQGGKASSGSFKPGDPKARKAGRKGGFRTGDDLDYPEE